MDWHRCVRSFVPSLPPHTVPLRLSMVFVLQASILAVCRVSLVTAPAGYCVDQKAALIYYIKYIFYTQMLSTWDSPDISTG